MEYLWYIWLLFITFWLFIGQKGSIFNRLTGFFGALIVLAFLSIPGYFILWALFSGRYGLFIYKYGLPTLLGLLLTTTLYLIFWFFRTFGYGETKILIILFKISGGLFMVLGLLFYICQPFIFEKRSLLPLDSKLYPIETQFFEECTEKKPLALPLKRSFGNVDTNKNWAIINLPELGLGEFTLENQGGKNKGQGAPFRCMWSDEWPRLWTDAIWPGTPGEISGPFRNLSWTGWKMPSKPWECWHFGKEDLKVGPSGDTNKGWEVVRINWPDLTNIALVFEKVKKYGSVLKPGESITYAISKKKYSQERPVIIWWYQDHDGAFFTITVNERMWNNNLLSKQAFMVAGGVLCLLVAMEFLLAIWPKMFKIAILKEMILRLRCIWLKREKEVISMAKAPDPSNIPTLSEKEFSLEIHRIEKNLKAMEMRGASSSVLKEYLNSTRAGIMAKLATKELKKFEDYFQQREKTFKAVMGAYDAEVSLNQLSERTRLQHETEMAKLKAEHERAIQDQELAKESGHMKTELEVSKIKSDLALERRKEQNAEALADIQAKTARLKAEKILEELEHPHPPAPKEPRLSPEERLVRRLTKLEQLEKDLEEQGVPEEKRKSIIEEARRAILVEHRMGGQE